MKKPHILPVAASLLVAIAIPVVLRADEAQSLKPLPAMTAQERAFLAENEAAMNKMMDGMAAKPTGDVDRDFVAMMTPHHQGAIDMAVIELRYGKNEQLRRIAQEIVVDQTQEIAAMKLAIGEPATDTSPAPTQQQPASSVEEHHSGMHMNMPGDMKK
jgi:hypothetical protein